MRATTLTQINQPVESGLHGEIRCAQCPIRDRAVCAHCDSDQLLLLEQAKFHRSFDPGQAIIWEGDRMDFVASVVSGVATLTQTMDDGRTQMVGLLLPSDFLGRPGRGRAAYNATAATRVELCCFRRKPFDELMRYLPQVGQRLLEMTLDELDAAREWMLLLGRKTAREKIASFLSLIARRSASMEKRSPGGRMEIELPLTREAMADYLGLTLETVSRQISALKRDGVIALNGKRGVIVPDYARLVEESGDDADGGLLV